MKSLLKLSRSRATRVVNIPDGVPYARRCVTASQLPGSYHSRLFLHESQVGQAWLIDFASPSNFRVTQVTGGEDGLFDRWATIGDQHYEWVTFQLFGKPETAPHYRNNQFLTVDKWLSFLAKHELLVGADAHRFSGRRYVLLEYRTSRPSGLLTSELSHEVSVYRETVCAWIDEETGRLAKGAIEVTGQVHTGAELPPIRLQQIFAGYGHDMGFDPAVPFPELTSKR